MILVRSVWICLGVLKRLEKVVLMLINIVGMRSRRRNSSFEHWGWEALTLMISM